ncbi:MAG: single-stranded-DNA-specific exonuclease RecJ [Ignavibacteriales bacterium]|nr:single-stranded-DNA-specific exonuclease RecJ [Ignavibacteriales bacterium]
MTPTPVREYRWKFRSNGANSLEKLEAVKKLSDQLNTSSILSEILFNRGVDSFDKARAYFRPEISDFNDPFLMDGMDIAVDRISHALANKESIVVYGDYDVDGTNGASLLWSFLTSVGASVKYYIPDRIKEGYGISNVGIDRTKQSQASLLISIDCGITAAPQIEYARSLGIDVIVCDHHEPGEPLPKAFAVLDPLKPNCSYPFKNLCGCGVGFKLVQALAQKDPMRSLVGDSLKQRLEHYLQYVTLATIADIVPLKDENRAMVKLGLELINSNPIPGIRALIATSGLAPGRITAGQVVFILAPRINAVGRLGDAMRAVDLLTCDNYDKALQLAQVMEEENLNRRRIDEETFIQAQEIVDQYLNFDNDTAIVLHQEKWHPGVIGIVASRVVERYYRPAIMMTTVDGVAKGSARSVAGFDIYQALKRCEDKLIQFGGHKYAAGLTVEIGKLGEFKEAFNAIAKELLTEELLTPEIKIDTEIDLKELTPKFIRVLSQFAPFGPDNLRPVFVAKGVTIAGQPKIVGHNHLRFKVRSNGRVMDAIGFNLGGLMDKVTGANKTVDLAFSLDEGEYGGETYPQLKIRDLKGSS